ncbi:MAG: hypothetical protein AAGA77_26335, partial [Bacteroidota bacterium]
AFLVFGAFSFANAQFLTYSLTNTNPTVTWDYKMTDAGSGIVTQELGILPGTTRTGVVGGGFGFILEFKCANSNGCGTSQVVPGPTTGVGVPIACAVPTGIKYKVDTVIPLFLWHLELKFG